jgi:hypothetical protein
LSVSDLPLQIEYYDEESDNILDDVCRKLTLTDVSEALKTFKINQKLSRKRRISSESDKSIMIPEQSK